MLGHTGTMTDSHLRAAIRVALAARGLEFSQADLQAVLAEQWQNGVQLRQKILAASMAPADLSLFREAEPGFWDRIPLIADLGFRQTSVFQSLISTRTECAPAAAVLGASFNLAITLIDYALDERGASALFHVLNPSLMRDIFAATGEAERKLAAAAQQSQDVCERALWGLLAFCASSGRNLLLATANQAAWQDLGNNIAILLASEKEVATARWPSAAEAHRLLPYMETKSCLPSVAALHIARLAHTPATILRETDLMTVAMWLGTLFWRLDDLVDLLKDLRTGTPNAVLLRLTDRLAAEGRWFASDKDIYDELDSGADELARLARLAGQQESIERRNALIQFTNLVISGWTGALGAIAAQPPDDDGRIAGSRIFSNALTFLLAQQADGFQEAIHHLHFPRLLDEGVRYETRPSILSHRAVIVDAMLDAAEAGLDCPRKVLASEIMAILRSKHRDARGGWSYIQEAPELPPDADDLGQVLQVLARFGGPELASICDEAIRILLDSSGEDGSFCTWILDPRGHSFAHERMLDYLTVMGGWGVHPEVVANLLYGLCLYDPARYGEPLRRSVQYLEKVQNADGSWSSKWYCGPFYGTWRAASVLGRLTPDSKALMRSQEFLCATCHPNGGWGEGTPEPLSTALAMLALHATGIETNADVLSAGAEYLSQTQQPDGGWPAYPWISFPTIDGPVVHGSASVTTAFCLKALLAAEKMVTEELPTALQASMRSA
jgi:squalene-hopene/tetraprenyl-beta-curcumene cyclase